MVHLIGEKLIIMSRTISIELTLKSRIMERYLYMKKVFLIQALIHLIIQKEPIES